MNVNTFMRESIRTIDICSTNSSEIFHQRIEEMDQRHAKILSHHKEKVKLNRQLTIQVEEERKTVEELIAINEKLTVENIRVETQNKKILKNLDKLKSFNASRMQLDVGESDKLKMCKSKLKLKITKMLTNTHINSDLKGFTRGLEENSLQPFQLNSNSSKETIRDALWENIADSCGDENRRRWENLFEF